MSTLDDGDDDFPDYGAPPHLTMPDGTAEEQLAWLKARIAEGLASGPAIEMTPEDMAESVKRRGRERLARLRNAA